MDHAGKSPILLHIHRWDRSAFFPGNFGSGWCRAAEELGQRQESALLGAKIPVGNRDNIGQTLHGIREQEFPSWWKFPVFPLFLCLPAASQEINALSLSHLIPFSMRIQHLPFSLPFLSCFNHSGIEARMEKLGRSGKKWGEKLRFLLNSPSGFLFFFSLFSFYF